jgi:mannose-1-phosphate guanylyltransferase / phosphomannomutase
MKAVVMAGGEGSRLRPLTLHRPKPLVPVVNKPVMQHILELLAHHGIRDIVVTLHYLAEEIEEYFGDGSEFGVNLEYTVEDTPLGTAGSVKKAQHLLRDDTFLIISGDALTDVDLTALIQYHRERRSLATLCLTRVESPLEYGVVITDNAGRIRRFLEKPEWSEVFSDTVNTGIYVLEPEVLDYMEPEKVYDWSGDIFPQILKEKKPLYGHETPGYWCDIGSLYEYRRAHMDVLQGKVNVNIPGTRRPDRDIWVGPGSEIEPDVVVQEPALIGSGCRIKRGTVIEEFSVIGDNCIVGPNARVVGGILFNGVYLGEQSRVRAGIIGPHSILSRGTAVEEGAVLGDRVRLQKNASVATRVKIWPDKMVEPGASVNSTFVWGPTWTTTLFADNRVSGLANIQITPELATKLATAYGAFLGRRRTVVISRDTHPASRMIKRAMIAGLMAAGVNVQDLRAVPKSVISYTINKLGVDGGLHVYMSGPDPQQVSIEFFNSEGVPYGKNAQRKIENILGREDFRRADYNEVGTLDYRPKAVDYYTDGLVHFIRSHASTPRRYQLVVDCAYSSAALVVPPVLGRLGCELVTLNAFPDARKQQQAGAEQEDYVDALSTIVPTLHADLGAVIGGDGETLTLVDEKGRALDGNVLLAIACMLAFQAKPGAEVAVPVTAPSVIEELAVRFGGQVVRTKSDTVSLMDHAVQHKEATAFAGDVQGRFVVPQFQPAADAIGALAWLLEMMARQGTSLGELAERIPTFTVDHQAVPCPGERKGEIMRLLSEQVAAEKAEFLDGIKVYGDASSWVLVKPDASEPHFHVYAESGSREEAQRLIDAYRQRIETLSSK